MEMPGDAPRDDKPNSINIVCSNRFYSFAQCSRATTGPRRVVDPLRSHRCFHLLANMTAVVRGKMSKGRTIRAVSSSLSAALNQCKRAANRFWQLIIRVACSITNSQRENQIARPVNISGDSTELKDFLKTLHIGDRLSILCDDGVLVIEKVSQTQIQVVHSQVLAELVH
jgi:hypothetical protein